VSCCGTAAASAGCRPNPRALFRESVPFAVAVVAMVVVPIL
jgi:hypothetical protein